MEEIRKETTIKDEKCVNNAIKTEKLAVGYDKVIIVPEFDVALKKGGITSIIGANGCGKSTVLKAIGRIIPKAGGVVIVNDNDNFVVVVSVSS